MCGCGYTWTSSPHQKETYQEPTCHPLETNRLPWKVRSTISYCPISHQHVCHRVKEVGRKSHETEMKAVQGGREKPSWLSSGPLEVFNSASSPSPRWHVGRTTDGWRCSSGEACSYILRLDFFYLSAQEEQGDLFGRMVMKVGRHWLHCSFLHQSAILTSFSSCCRAALFSSTYFSLKGGIYWYNKPVAQPRLVENIPEQHV